MTDPLRDAAVVALCDFAEQPHPGRAGEAIDALERYLRASQPATESASRPDLFGWLKCEDCGGSGESFTIGSDVSNGPCGTCNGLGRLLPIDNGKKQPAPRLVEGVSDEEPAILRGLRTWVDKPTPDHGFAFDRVQARRVLEHIDASRSSAAKDARIAELEAALADVRVEAIGAGPYRREALGRIVEKVDAARRIREEPAK